jgi:ribonuclease P/MRP protein subunit RPP20
MSTDIARRHKTLHLHAMGAAIPHLLQLSLSLPEILPYSPEEIHTEVLTGTVDVQDEVIPEDEDEDISLRTRGKSTVSVVIKIGDGKDKGAHTGKGKGKSRNGVTNGNSQRRNGRKQRPGGGNKGGSKSPAMGTEAPDRIVIRAEDMED